MKRSLIILTILLAFGCKKSVVERNCCTDPPFSYFLNNVAFAVPNFFSPNGDGVNDTFGPLVNNNVISYEFKVVDTNQTLWEGTGDANAGLQAGHWNGRFNGEVQEGIFGWEIIVYTINEDTLDFRGQVCCISDTDAYCVRNEQSCITANQLDGIDFNQNFDNGELLCGE
ncbi:MAG: hypothetical protein AAF502_05115 [Bacteroidota bacterium]